MEKKFKLQGDRGAKRFFSKPRLFFLGNIGFFLKFFSSFFHFFSFFLQISFFEEKHFHRFVHFSNVFSERISVLSNNGNFFHIENINKKIITSLKEIEIIKHDLRRLRRDRYRMLFDKSDLLSAKKKKERDMNFQLSFHRELLGDLEEYLKNNDDFYWEKKEDLKKNFERIVNQLNYLKSNRHLTFSKLIWHCSWWSSLTSIITIVFVIFDLFFFVIKKLRKNDQKEIKLLKYFEFIVLVWNSISLFFFFLFGFYSYFPRRSNWFDELYLFGFLKISRIYFYLIYQILWHLISPLFFIFYFFNKHNVYLLLKEEKKILSCSSLLSVYLWHFFVILRPFVFNFPIGEKNINNGICTTYPYDYFFWIINFDSKVKKFKLLPSFFFRNILVFSSYYFISFFYISFVSFLSDKFQNKIGEELKKNRIE